MLSTSQSPIPMNEIFVLQEKSNVISLGGIWKGIKITEEDIKEAREELLRRLEDKK